MDFDKIEIISLRTVRALRKHAGGIFLARQDKTPVVLDASVRGGMSKRHSHAQNKSKGTHQNDGCLEIHIVSVF